MISLIVSHINLSIFNKIILNLQILFIYNQNCNFLNKIFYLIKPRK